MVVVIVIVIIVIVVVVVVVVIVIVIVVVVVVVVIIIIIRRMSILRNIFPLEEDVKWDEAIQQFPNKVPRFSNADDAIAFIKDHCLVGSNPMEPTLQHTVTTLTDWSQIQRILIPKMNEYDKKWERKYPINNMISNNRYFNGTSSNNNDDGDDGDDVIPKSEPNSYKVYKYLLSRVNLSIHSMLTKSSTFNTLSYLFHHMKCGILVMIRNNNLVIFAPFVNKDYKNTWGHLETLVEGSLEKYYMEKEVYYRAENIITDRSKWWANGNIICNEDEKPSANSPNQWWSDHFLFQLKDMIAETCRKRDIPDCDFFINKRDYPQLKFHKDNDDVKEGDICNGIPVEPYGFIFDKDDSNPDDDVQLNRECYKSYAPILSFYTSDRFADIPLPPSEDWEAATGEVFPSSFINQFDANGNLAPDKPRDLFTENNFKKFNCPWENKIDTAFFRGTATGGGVTKETNQRINAAFLCREWEDIPELNGSLNKPPYLDAKIVGWNMRDKKIAGSKMTFIRPQSFRFDGDRKKNFVEIYKQSTYKYLLYIEGHCAACRYGFMMRLGSVILKVDRSCVADQMWYFPLLRPYYDHVPVKADLSDLKEKIEWCRSHDAECKQIAANASYIYDRYISKEGVLDYIQLVFFEISKRWRYVSSWAYNPNSLSSPPAVKYNINNQCFNDEYCTNCEALRKLKSQQGAESMDIQDEKKSEAQKKKEAIERKKKENREREILKAETARKAAEAIQQAAIEASSEAAQEVPSKRVKTS